MIETIKFASVLLAIISVIVGLVIRFEMRFNKLSLKINAVEQKIEPFWEIIKNNLPKLFTENPSKELLDTLDKADSLTKKELDQAKLEFEEEMKTVEPSKRFNYLLALWRLDIASNGKG